MPELRFATIGCGGMIETVHCPNMAAVQGAKLVAYCDLDEAKARKLRATFGGEYVTSDCKKVFADKGIDGVLIAIGPKAHPAMVRAAAQAGKHVFVEKPLADSVAEAAETARVVEAAGVKFQHGTCNRLAPAVQRAKRLCPTVLYSFAQATSTVTHMPVHQIDLAINLFHTAPLARVYAGGGQMWHVEVDKDLPADSYSAVLTFADGSVHTYFQQGPMANALLGKYHFQLYGKDRVIYLANRFKECHYMPGGKLAQSWRFDGSDFDRGPFGYMGHFEELQDLVDAVREDRATAMPVRQAAYVTAVETAILRSIETRAVIDFRQYLKEHQAEFLMEGRA